MRREWSGWIKTRQWSEFEKLAKVEPSQALADTVAELELGFQDKPDRRALRKILFLLSLAGYEPREIDDSFGEAAVLPPPLSVAFMVSPDGAGDSIVTLGREERGRVAWLVAHLTSRDGITRAIEDTITLDEAQTRLLRLRNMAVSPSISAEVPVEVVLARLARAVSVTKSLPPVMAYWRNSLPKEFSPRHPGEGLPRHGRAASDLYSLMENLEPTRTWRLELGSLVPALEEMAAKRDPSESMPKDSESWHAMLAPHREAVFTPEVVEDHWTRLLDLAYLMDIKREAGVQEVLALADDLKANGPDSAYGKALTARTLVLLIETIQRRSAKERSTAANGS